jgi:hypothetical protein
MDKTPAGVATIAGDAEVDRAIGTLVLALALIRWRAGCMTTRVNICCKSLDCSKPLEQARLKQEQRSARAMALESRSGFRGVFTAKTGRLCRLLQKALLQRSKPMWAPCSSGRNITGQPSPTGTSRSSASKFCTGTGGVVQSTAARPSSMRPGAPPGIPLVVESAQYIPLREAWLRDRGHDSSGLIAVHLSHAAPCTLKMEMKQAMTEFPESGYSAAHVSTLANVPRSALDAVDGRQHSRSAIADFPISKTPTGLPRCYASPPRSIPARRSRRLRVKTQTADQQTYVLCRSEQHIAKDRAWARRSRTESFLISASVRRRFPMGGAKKCPESEHRTRGRGLSA